jgi:hypothetical protein
MQTTLQSIKYHYLIMPQQEILINQVLEEILRERTTSFLVRKKTRDFWLISAPSFVYSEDFLKKLNQTNFFVQKQKQISESLSEKSFSFYGALVSTDEIFINWIRLRLGYFENINNPDENNKNINCDGLYGFFELNNNINTNLSPLIYVPNYISPKVKRKQHEKIIEIYYEKILQKI